MDDHRCDTPATSYPGLLPPAPWDCPECGRTWRFRRIEHKAAVRRMDWETAYQEGEWVPAETA